MLIVLLLWFWFDVWFAVEFSLFVLLFNFFECFVLYLVKLWLFVLFVCEKLCCFGLFLILLLAFYWWFVYLFCVGLFALCLVCLDCCVVLFLCLVFVLVFLFKFGFIWNFCLGCFPDLYVFLCCNSLFWFWVRWVCCSLACLWVGNCGVVNFITISW